MPRPTKPELIKEMMEKINTIHMLTQEIMVACALYKESFDKKLTIMDISDSLGDLTNVENTLYILNGKLRKNT